MGRECSYTAKTISEITGKSKQAIMQRADKEQWAFVCGNGRGGKTKKYNLPALPADIQSAIYNKEGAPLEMLPALSPSVAAMAVEKITGGSDFDGMFPSLCQAFAAKSTITPETAVSEKDLQCPRIRRILAILREVDAMPRTWSTGKRKWIDAVALRYDCSFQAVYRWLNKYEKRGIAGLRHTKSGKDKPRKWTPEAIDWWVSLCGKREHRDADRKDLYNYLAVEARRRNWEIGEYESANWWFKKKWNPLMEAMQRGGLRALDNALPPILRDYSDLAPFEILVGDQHRFDRWVVDEETGEVFRPEGYLWQDLRTRIIYGAAVDRKYDAWLIGLALRIGIACYGAFTSIYTDNGKPELSRYLTGILANLASLGMAWEKTDDVLMDLVDVEADEVDPFYIAPGTHRKAIVKNAKAKMIEGTFFRLERIMASRFLLPGHTKRMSDDIHWQDVDHKEAQSLAKQGRLLTSREFALAMYRALDYYNSGKPHRGVLKEWAWKPKPKEATPMDCLRACYNDGWRPRMISNDAADLIFLARTSRVIHQGRINFENEFYEHDALMELHKQRVDLRYNPMTCDELHVFRGGSYLCTAVPVERSSMKDLDLAGRKIAEKRERRKRFAEEFRRIATLAPDFRQYSTVPEAERVAALIGDDKRKRAAAQIELTRPVTQEELDAHIDKMEQSLPLPLKSQKPLPARPGIFVDEITRFLWLLDYLKAGGELTAEDNVFKQKYLAAQTPGQRDYYEFMIEGFGG